ncbi:class I SAM-dependent methyltransferase [Mycetocola zhadangensis]|uniref:class I SAM-dependent methyltransferase n=1 Tax=Mycetocola zhadangensis TaxID=1164595 RepID=UPI003A4D8440
MTTPDPAHFERHADIYERARPAYPEELWRRLGDLGLLTAGGRALDLGAGTGQATGRLLAEGMHVTAVEPGPGLAARLAERFPQVTVVPTTAERAALPEAQFDVAVAATSIHWMDLSVVLPKVHDALSSDGRLLVWRHVFGDPCVPTDFRLRVAEITHQRSHAMRPGPADIDTDGWADSLEASGLFRVEYREVFRWSIRLNAVEVRDLFTTFSDWSPVEVSEAEQAVRELGGHVVEHYLTPLLVLSRV